MENTNNKPNQTRQSAQLLQGGSDSLNNYNCPLEPVITMTFSENDCDTKVFHFNGSSAENNPELVPRLHHDHGPLDPPRTTAQGLRLLAALREAKQESDVYLSDLINRENHQPPPEEQLEDSEVTIKRSRIDL